MTLTGGPHSEPNLFHFVCPACRGPLVPQGADLWHCPEDGIQYAREQGIWRFLTPARRAYFQKFVEDYEAVRKAEGRGSEDPAYYRSLPFADLSRKFSADWKIRARSFRVFLKQVLLPLESKFRRPMRILDLGAGNGWLSYRLAQRGHLLAAVDLLTNPGDGLGAFVFYDVPFTPIQAEFDRLPFQEDQADLVVFNASLHYSTCYQGTLKEAQRVLSRGGRLVILDSPVYHQPTSGTLMVLERHVEFTKRFGFASDSLPSENFLTFKRLDQLAQELNLHWRLIRPYYGVRWTLRPWKAHLLGRREPASFFVIEGLPLEGSELAR